MTIYQQELHYSGSWVRLTNNKKSKGISTRKLQQILFTCVGVRKLTHPWMVQALIVYFQIPEIIFSTTSF